MAADGEKRIEFVLCGRWICRKSARGGGLKDRRVAEPIERLSPVIEYGVLWHQALLVQNGDIEIGSAFGTNSVDMHAQGRLNVFGEKFDSSVYYDPECSARTKRGKTVHGYDVQFLADLRFGLIYSLAVFPAGDGFRPQIAD
jgi:hypothetical protein